MVHRYVKCPPTVLLCKNALIGPKNWSHPNYRWQSHICEEHLRVINLVLCDSLMDSETGHVSPRGFLDLDRVQHVRSSTLIFAGTGPTTSFVRALIVRRRREWCCNCSSLPPGRRVIFCILPLLVVLFALIGTDLELWLMTTLRFTFSWKYGPYGQTGLWSTAVLPSERETPSRQCYHIIYLLSSFHLMYKTIYCHDLIISNTFIDNELQASNNNYDHCFRSCFLWISHLKCRLRSP